MDVRPAEPRDAAAIAAVHVRAWQEGYRELLPGEFLDRLSAADRERAWRGLLVGELLVLVAEDEGEVAGFCTVLAPSRDGDAGEGVAELTALYVEPARWRQGAGGALLSAVFDRLRGAGWTEVTAWVIEGNERALAAYAAHGFERDGSAKHEPIGGLAREEAPPQVRLRARL